MSVKGFIGHSITGAASGYFMANEQYVEAGMVTGTHIARQGLDGVFKGDIPGNDIKEHMIAAGLMWGGIKLWRWLTDEQDD